MNPTDLNDKIVERIKIARNERGFTQKNLADELNKTPAAISDMERGKVQVSAVELYLLAKMLDKPVEYFFGEDFGGTAIQDIIAVTRLQDNETKTNTIEIARMIMELNSLNKKISKYEKGADVPDEIVKKFYDTFVPFSRVINGFAKKFNEVEEFLDVEIRTRKIKLTDKNSK